MAEDVVGGAVTSHVGLVGVRSRPATTTPEELLDYQRGLVRVAWRFRVSGRGRPPGTLLKRFEVKRAEGGRRSNCQPRVSWAQTTVPERLAMACAVVVP